MPTLEARIETERPSRYLVQFCKHAAAMGKGGHTPRMHLHGMMARREVQVDAEWSDTRGTVRFVPWGQCTLGAEAETLTLRIEATDEEGLHQIRDVINRDLERFSRRNPLTVTWHQPETSGTDDGQGLPRHGRAAPHRRRLQVILLVIAVVLVIVVHLGLAGTIVADSKWTGVATDVVLVLVVLKLALIALVRLGIRRRKAVESPDET